MEVSRLQQIEQYGKDVGTGGKGEGGREGGGMEIHEVHTHKQEAESAYLDCHVFRFTGG